MMKKYNDIKNFITPIVHFRYKLYLFDFIKTIFQKRNSGVAKNIYALSIIQITNYIFPIITIPYVSRIFGPDTFGLLNFSTSFVSYAGLILNYGFDLSATRAVAQNRDNKSKLIEIFNNVLFSKFLLLAIITIAFVIILFSVDKISNYKTLYLILYFGQIVNIFFPTWFFQGMEKLTITAIFTFIVKFLFTILVFVLIKNQSDYIFYPLASIIGQVIVSIISMYLIIKNYNISIFVPRFKQLLITLKESFGIFFSTIVINLYTNTNVVILGFLSTDFEVGLYTAAYKIVIIFMALIGTISQAVYPNIGHTFSQSYKLGINKIYMTMKIVIPITLFTSLILFFFSGIFVKILFGEKFNTAIDTLKILSFLPLITGLTNIFGLQGLLNMKKDKQYTIITSIGALIGLSLNFLLIPLFKHNGTAISWLLTEFIIMILMFFAFIKSKKDNSNLKTPLEIKSI